MVMVSGSEASALTLLVQAEVAEDDRASILRSLTGDALEIARVLLGENVHPSAETQSAVDGLREWAAGLADQP